MGRAEALGYTWDFGGTAGSGITTSQTFGRSGTYAVTLTVTDAFGWPSTVTHNVTIANVAPVVAAFDGADLIATETYAVTGSFADPGNETWSATVDYGDGSGAQPLALSGKSFSLSHAYADTGTFTVTVQVQDDAGGSGTATATVRVASSAATVQQLGQMVAGLLAHGDLTRGEATALQASLDAAARQIGRGDASAARGELGAFINKVNAEVASGRLSASAGQALITLAQRLIATLTA